MSLNPFSKPFDPQSLTSCPASLGLHLRFEFSWDADAGAVRAFDARLHRLLDFGGLESSGTRGQLTVWSDDRHLTMQDQVDLLLWAIGQRGPQAVEVGPWWRLVGGAGPASATDGPGMPARLPTLRAVRGDPALTSIAFLFARGRVTAAQVAEILGGYHLPATLH